ncbi:uncharacterized protein LOC106674140 isoform X2 [Cimex lectularius]|nr:uncharacterized protein LOC106674140 isoform X2 [Cimex lectularius]
MSGEETEKVKEAVQILTNGTDPDLLTSSHLDAPNEGMYMLCGVLIAMFLVAIIIILLAVTISKLRKREDSSVVANNNNINNNNNTVIQETEVRTTIIQQTTVPVEPPPFLWRYSNSSQFSLSNNDQTALVHTLPCEEIGECKGFRKNLRGKWRRLVKKKPEPEVYTIPPEFRDQLKQIYVY